MDGNALDPRVFFVHNASSRQQTNKCNRKFKKRTFFLCKGFSKKNTKSLDRHSFSKFRNTFTLNDQLSSKLQLFTILNVYLKNDAHPLFNYESLVRTEQRMSMKSDKTTDYSLSRCDPKTTKKAAKKM